MGRATGGGGGSGFFEGLQKFFAPERDPETGLTGDEARRQAKAAGKKTYVYKGNEYKLPSATNMSLQPGDKGYYIGSNSRDPNLVGPSKSSPQAGRKSVTPGGGSQRNVTEYPSVMEGRGTVPGRMPSKMAPRGSVAPRVASKPAGEYVAPSSPEAALTAGIPGLPGAQSGMAQETGSGYDRTFYSGDTPESALEVAKQSAPMRRGLFGEEISPEDWDAMTRRNKEAAGFWGQFKKGGQVKKKPAKTTKKYASGGSVSSASKRGDGCAQRGKTKGRMV